MNNIQEREKKMRKRNLFMSATLMCSFFIIAFHFDQDGVQWFWTGMEIVPLILGISAIAMGILWFLASKNKTKKV